MAEQKYTGGCQCGAASFTISSAKLLSYVCHCLDCQHQAASAFGISVPTTADKFESKGALSSFIKVADSGGRTECFFCPTCGTRLYHQSQQRPDVITVKGGALDNPEVINPIAHLWVRSKQNWVELPEGVPQFETQPDDFISWRKLIDEG